MKNLSISIEQLDGFLNQNQEYYDFNIFFFWNIIDNMESFSLIEKSEHKKKYFVSIFSSLLLCSWDISDFDLNTFLWFIESKDFIQTYARIIDNISYTTMNNSFTQTDINKVSRKNNPFFKIAEIRVKINNLIINSKIKDALDSWNDEIEFEWKKIVRIWDLNYEVIDYKDDLFILYNEKLWYSLFRKNKDKWDYELIISWYEKIEFYLVDGNHIALLHKKNKFIIYDIDWDVNIWTWDKIISCMNFWDDLLIHYLYNGDNVIATNSGDELFRFSKAQFDFNLETLLSERYLVLRSNNLSNSISTCVLFDIKFKKVILSDVSKFEIEDNRFLHYEILSNEHLSIKWLFDLLESRNLLIWNKNYSLIKIWEKIFVKFDDDKGISLYDIEMNRIFDWNKSIDLFTINSEIYMIFENSEWYSLYNLDMDKIVLVWKKELKVDKETWIVTYKDKWIFNFQKIVQL